MSTLPIRRSTRTAIAGFALLAPFAGSAPAGVFELSASVANTTTTATYTRAEDVIRALTTAELQRLDPGYSGVEAASLSIDFRGLPLIARYPQANSAQLQFSVPTLGINVTFQGANRDQSQAQLEDYLKKNIDGILNRLFRELARVSPADPIAGNPNSLMSRLVAGDYSAGVFGFAGKKDETASNNLIGVGAQFGSYKQGGVKSNAWTIPLSYTMRADLDPRRQIGFHLPISVIDMAGSTAYSVAPSVMVRLPVTDHWSLSPAIGVGVTGSPDLGSMGSIASASLTSSYVFSVGTTDITIGNLVGYYQSLKVKTGDYSADPGLKNTVLRNGFAVSRPAAVFGSSGSVEASFVNTQFLGSELYIKSTNELGLSFGTNRSAKSARSYFRAGANLLHSDKSKGFQVNVGYWF